MTNENTQKSTCMLLHLHLYIYTYTPREKYWVFHTFLITPLPTCPFGRIPFLLTHPLPFVEQSGEELQGKLITFQLIYLWESKKSREKKNRPDFKTRGRELTTKMRETSGVWLLVIWRGMKNWRERCVEEEGVRVQEGDKENFKYILSKICHFVISPRDCQNYLHRFSLFSFSPKSFCKPVTWEVSSL